MRLPSRLSFAVLLVGLAGLQACSGGDEPEAKQSAGPAPSILFHGEQAFRQPGIEDNLLRRDPGYDEWRTEVLHEAAKPVLRGVLAHLLGHAGDEPPLAELLDPAFRGAARLRPELEEVYRDGRLRVLRGVAENEPDLVGADGLLAAGAALRAPFGREPFEAHFKIQSMDLEGDQACSSSVLLWVDGERLQQNMEWRVGWTARARAGDAEQEVRLFTLACITYEEVHADGPIFGERTEHLFADSPRYAAEVLAGVGQYRHRTDRLIGSAFLGMQGICVADVNGDDRDDLFVPQQSGFPNRLFLQGEDGRLVDVTREARVGILENTRSALLIDLDEDGDQDLVAAMGPAILTMQNDGKGRFKKPGIWPASTPGEIYSLSAADADGDGDLDVYCCRYGEEGILHGVPTPYHDADNGARNVFFRNDGGSFVEATAEMGLDDNNRKFSLASLWDDFDGDGDLDLYVANDFGKNHLYRNEGGKFRDVAEEVGAEDLAAGMGITAGDVDADGDVDLYVTNMFSSAGLRIVPQSKFMGGENQDVHGFYRRHARGNTLLAGNGDGTFEDVTVEARVSVGGWAWGAKLLDVNNDGLEDIYSPNGFVTNDDPDDM